MGSVGSVAVSQGSRLTMIFTSWPWALPPQVRSSSPSRSGPRTPRASTRTIGNLFSLLLFISLLCLVVGTGLGRQIVAWMQTPAEAVQQSWEYLVVSSLGMPFIFGYNAVCAVLRGMGDSTRPLLFVAIASVINLVLDLLFVAGLDMGAAGAAWATIIGQAVAFVVAVIYLYRRRDSFDFDFRRRSFRLEKFYTLTIIKLGLPMSLQYTVIGLSQTVITRLCQRLRPGGGGSLGRRRPGVHPGQRHRHVPDAGRRRHGGQNVGAGRIERVRKIVLYPAELRPGPGGGQHPVDAALPRAALPAV